MIEQGDYDSYCYDPRPTSPCTVCGHLTEALCIQDGRDTRTGLPLICRECNKRMNRSPFSFYLNEDTGGVCVYHYTGSNVSLRCEFSPFVNDIASRDKPREGELIATYDCQRERYSCPRYEPTCWHRGAYDKLPRKWPIEGVVNIRCERIKVVPSHILEKYLKGGFVEPREWKSSDIPPWRTTPHDRSVGHR